MWLAVTRLHPVCVCVCDPRRTPETDSPNPWGSIEPRLGTTVLSSLAEYYRSYGIVSWMCTRLGRAGHNERTEALIMA